MSSETAIDWAATGSMLSGIGTTGGAIAVLIAAIIGANTFKKWGQQKLAERKAEQAERILTATYNVRRLLSHIRSPAMWANELKAAEDKLKEKGQWEKLVGEDEQRRVTTQQAYYLRLQTANDSRRELEQCQPMARALFGEELEEAIDKLNRQFWTVQVYVDANARDRAGADQKHREKIDQAIFEGYPSPEENEMDKLIGEKVAIIESTCVPSLRLEQTRKQKKD